MFKRVADGYVLRYDAWFLGCGPVESHRLTESQKAAISARMRAVQDAAWKIGLLWIIPAFGASFGGATRLAAHRHLVLFAIPLAMAVFGSWPFLIHKYRGRGR